MTPSDRYVGPHQGHYVEPQPKMGSSFWVVIVSLLFVAVCAGALVGGVVSGDPSSVFFIAIIASSGVAIGVATTVSVNYYCNRPAAPLPYQADLALKQYGEHGEIQGTFPSEDDEEAPAEAYAYAQQVGGRLPARTPVDARIREVSASGMIPGDVSAMSPHTYDVESYAPSAYSQSEYRGNGYGLRLQKVEERQGPFDFSSVVSSRHEYSREDPPEETVGGCNPVCTFSASKDPAAPIVTADGSLVAEDSDVGLNSPSAMSAATRSVVSRYDAAETSSVVPSEATSNKVSKNDDVTSTVSSGVREASTPKVSSTSTGRTTTFQDSGLTQNSYQEMPTHSKNKVAGSEAGSAVSSVFLKPFAGMFGKKKTPSEAGSQFAGTEVSAGNSSTKSKKSSNTGDVDSTGNVGKGKPPMPNKKKDGLNTISGSYKPDRYAPSTHGNGSTFSTPPPKRIPSTPGGSSDAPSEFRSVAASSAYTGVASSTFDPKAHDRALRRTENNTGALGAAFNDMPVYYEEDESAVTSAVQSQHPAGALAYDVFAPPGPIGIVVDTVEQGCIVHSLKKTSPMQGLINPGDLIVALDDFDVRKMNAANLTKLMAKKSQQRERKFTLLPLDQ
eukprot:Nitzschia sp. Nitz4//scaffold52_size167869//89685//91526//NITZ4_002281-RA/size167869-processed-gene-0.98-mRNA-1//1//CDS//3329554050//6538//frame0